MKRNAVAMRVKREKGQVVLREYRESICLTQTELGKIVGVDARTISAYELGTRKPSTKVAVRLARLFKVRIEDIFPVYD